MRNVKLISNKRKNDNTIIMNAFETMTRSLTLQLMIDDRMFIVDAFQLSLPCDGEENE